MRTTSLLTTTLLAIVAFSGCLVDDPQPASATDPTDPSDSESASPSPTNTSNGPAPVAPVANLTADILNGTAPLTVNFTLADDAGAEVAQWGLNYGEGNWTNGTEVPATATYTFNASGAYNVTLELFWQGGVVNDTVTIVVEVSAPSVAPPSQTVFNSGPVIGCASDAGPDSCIVYNLGTDAEWIDGIWIAVEPGHVGMSFTAHSLAGDSDGWIFGEDIGTVLEAVNNGGDEAGGIVPAEAKWILIVSWMAPSDNIEVVFTPAAA